jgi:hypothetical protein
MERQQIEAYVEACPPEDRLIVLRVRRRSDCAGFAGLELASEFPEFAITKATLRNALAALGE